MVGIKQAVILAGGRGERLRPITDTIPKPMVSINGRPFLEYLVELLKDNGISEIVMLLGYLPNKIIEHFGDGSKFGIKIKYSVGAIEDETGARVRNAARLLDNNFLLLYCDNYWPLNLKKLFDFHISKKMRATVSVYSNEDQSTKNNMYLENYYITRYDPIRKETGLNCVDIGFFILERDILELMPAHNFSFEKELLPSLIEDRNLSGYLTRHKYYSIGSPERLETISHFLIPRKVLFLDRDGVINEKPPKAEYITSWEKFRFLPGTLEALRLLSVASYELYLITNQAGIGRGIMSDAALESIHKNMEKVLQRNGIAINGIYHCPHDWEEGCACRKPQPGLFFQAARKNHLDLTKALFIGDDERDLEAGEAAGCRTFLVSPEQNLLKIVQEEILA